MKYISLLFCCAIIWGCSKTEKSKNEKITEVETIDITKGFFDDSTAYLSDFTDSIQYIPLESKGEKSLLSDIDQIFFCDTNIFISDRDQKVILRFNKNGKFLNRIGKIGKGPGEYAKNEYIGLNREKKNILVWDNPQTRFITYSFNGDFIKQEKINEYLIFNIYPKGNLIYTLRCFPVMIQHNNYPINIYNNQLKLQKSLINRSYESENLTKCEARNKYLYRSLGFYNYKDSLSYWDYNYDTIYRITYEEAIPRYVITQKDDLPHNVNYSTQPIGKYNFYLDFFETEKYFFFSKSFSTEGDVESTILYNKDSKECFNLRFDYKSINSGFINDIDGGWPFKPEFYTDTDAIGCYFFPYELKKLLKTEQFKNIKVKYPQKRRELIEMIEESNIRQNPILMLVKLN